MKNKAFHHSGRKAVKRSLGGNILVFIGLTVFGIFSVLPFIYSILQAFKPLNELFLYPPRFFVTHPTTDNFYLLGQLTQNLWVPFERYLFNSIFVSVTATFLHVIFASMAALPLAKYEFPGRKFLDSLIVLSLLFTAEVTAIPSFVMLSRMGLTNSYWALILPPIASSLGLYLMRQFICQIPSVILEAATVDGAGLFRTYWSIVMPSVKPAWLTLIIFSFQGIWNREGLEYIYNEPLKTLPTILKQITSGGLSRSGSAAAAAIILMLPPMIVFIISQSNVLETMAHSGIKE